MFTQPLYLFALFGIPVVVALHLYRKRLREQVVSALFLWMETGDDSLSGRKRERLIRSTSFWCELLAALLIALALAGPQSCSERSATHLVVVLDGSAAMGATAGDETLRDRAVAVVEERIQALGEQSRVSIIQSGLHTQVLCGPGAPPKQARESLRNFRPEAPRHDLASAVSLGLEIASGGALLIISPRFQPERLPPETELIALGESLSNTGIIRARRTRATAKDGDRIELTVGHYGQRTLETNLVIAIGEDVIATHTLDLQPDERRDLSFELPAGTPAVIAKLTEGGALAIDDSAFLTPPPARTLAIGTTLPIDQLARLGLAQTNGSPIDRWLSVVPDSIEAPPELAHVILGAPPASPDDVPWGGVALAFDHSGEEREDWIGPFLIEKRHPLLSGVTLDGVIWSSSTEVNLSGGPLVSTGNRPLLVEERVAGTRQFIANLDPSRSTLAHSPDWPILLTNLAELARDRLPGPDQTSLAVGEPFVYRARREGTYRLLGPDIDRVIRSREVLVLDEDVARPGHYELIEGDRSLCQFGVSFSDANESDLRELASGERASIVRLGKLQTESNPMERALYLLALGLFALDWWWLSRRSRPSSGTTEQELSQRGKAVRT